MYACEFGYDEIAQQIISKGGNYRLRDYVCIIRWKKYVISTSAACSHLYDFPP